MRGVLVGLLLATASLLAHAQSELECKVVATYREARGEPLAAVKAVIQVIENRQRMLKKTACQIVKSPGQFPWAKHQKNWKISKNMLTLYVKAFTMGNVVSERTFYFNHRPFKTFGKFEKKVGRLYFYKSSSQL